MPVRRNFVRSAVDELLTRHKVLSPPVHVDEIARAEGVRVVFRDLRGDLSGFLLRRPDGSLIGVNNHHPLVRQRFTIAHELGHYTLFRSDGVHVDHSFELRNRLASQGVDDREIEANLFAAELLLPRRLLAADVGVSIPIDPFDDSVIERLAKRYKVSVQALTIRLSDLQYI